MMSSLSPGVHGRHACADPAAGPERTHRARHDGDNGNARARLRGSAAASCARATGSRHHGRGPSHYGKLEAAGETTLSIATRRRCAVWLQVNTVRRNPPDAPDNNNNGYHCPMSARRGRGRRHRLADPPSRAVQRIHAQTPATTPPRVGIDTTTTLTTEGEQRQPTAR